MNEGIESQEAEQNEGDSSTSQNAAAVDHYSQKEEDLCSHNLLDESGSVTLNTI